MLCIFVQGKGKDIFESSLGFGFRGGRSCGCRGSGVHSDSWQHLWRAVGEKHGVHWGAVKFVEIEASEFRVGICVDLPFLLLVSYWPTNENLMKGIHTANFSVWLYLVYVAVSAVQGLDSSCRPSTLKGDSESDRSAFMTTVPCWNCMIASGHDGSAATYQSASSGSFRSIGKNIRFEIAL